MFVPTFESARAQRARCARIMREKGVLTDGISGLDYYTGYSYETLYDWDQYFEAILQLYAGWDTRLIRNGVHIFLANQDERGFIYRSVPRAVGCGQGDEHVKPFLAQISLLVWKNDGTLDWLSAEEYEKLKKYLLYWLRDKDRDGDGLSTWDSAPHTGMDNQHERAGWWYDGFCEGVDLNAFLVRECRAMSRVAALRGDPDSAAFFASEAERVARAVQTLWDEQDGIFYDRDERTGAPIRVKYVGAFATLWAGIATPAQAGRMVREHILNPREFWRPFPLPALSADEPGYTKDFLKGDLGCNWRAYTWVPTNYYVFHGLMAYGYAEPARELARITRDRAARLGDREYYAAESERGAGLDPFWGWSLLAHFMPGEFDAGFDPTRLDD